jgi:LPXTG-motif cell wall-anchored protein
VCVLAPSTGAADGLPVLGIDTSKTGIASTGSDARYVADSDGTKTYVAKIARNGGTIRQSRFLSGKFTVPAVSYDGTTAGLSADGRGLVLIEPRKTFPRSQTRFVVLDANSLKSEHAITLRGDFSFDAVSPDASTIYLIEYLSPNDPTAYAVRGYDVARERLLPEPIVDPDETGDEMSGLPLTRETSADGRWAYTLYNGSKENFVHALDTTRGTATCIDLEAIPDKEIGQLDLHAPPGGEALLVSLEGQRRATIDTESFEVTYPTASSAGSHSTGGGTGGEGWLWLAAAGGVAAIVAALIIRRRRTATAA